MFYNISVNWSPSLLRAVILVVLSCCLEADSARAQGLFQGGRAAPGADQVLTFAGSLFGAYDEVLRSAAGPSEAQQGLREQGIYSGLNLGVTFLPQGRDFHFSASAMSSMRHYSEVSDLVAASQTANLGAQMRLSRRTNAHVQVGSAYTPYFAYQMTSPLGLGTGEFLPLPERYRDYAASNRRVLAHNGSASLDRTLFSHSNLTMRYSARYTDSLGLLEDSTDQAAGITFSNRFRRTGLSVSYNRRKSDYRSVTRREPTDVQDLQVSIERSWMRSPTRGTMASVSMGPSQSNQGSQRRRSIGGSATLGHRFGRTWASNISYNRGVNFVEGIADSISSDGVGLTLQGLLSRRINLMVAARFVKGEIGLSLLSSNYETYSGSAGLQFAVSRSMALFGECLFLHYEYGGGVPLPADYLGWQDRSSVTVGLAVHVPLLTQEPRN